MVAPRNPWYSRLSFIFTIFFNKNLESRIEKDDNQCFSSTMQANKTTAPRLEQISTADENENFNAIDKTIPQPVNSQPSNSPGRFSDWFFKHESDKNLSNKNLKTE